MLNIMAVRWSKTEPGVATRLGVGVIDELEWIKAERTWSLVVLG
jgi:hypothetical protein